MRLYDLTEQYKDLLDMIEEGGDPEELGAMLAGLEDRIEQKAEGVASVMKQLEADAKMFDDEAKRLAGKKAAIEANRQRLKVYLEDELRKLGKDKIEGRLFNVWLQANPPSVHITDPGLIPSQYKTTPAPTISKSAIMAALQTGQFVPGAEIKQEKSLRVK